MSGTKTLSTITVLLIIGAALIISSQHRSQTALRDENASLRQNLAQLALEKNSLSNRLAGIRGDPDLTAPASPAQKIADSKQAEGASGTNLIAWMMHGGEMPTLTPDQLKAYLEQNHRNAASLLTAYRASHDSSLLDEAMEKYTNNAEVAFEAIFKKDASPAEKRQWLEAFKKAAPENTLPAFLSALDYFKAGQTDQAAQELTAASSRQRFNDYTAERIQNFEEAYRAAGYSSGDAKIAANWGVALPELSQMKPLAQEIVALASSYRQAGDEDSAQAALQTAMNLGKQLDAPPGNFVPLITQLVGIAVQRIILASMDPSSPYGDGTVQQQIDQLTQRRNSIQDMVKQSNPFREQMTSEDWLTYNERTRNFGEENAISWLLNKYSAKPSN